MNEIARYIVIIIGQESRVYHVMPPCKNQVLESTILKSLVNLGFKLFHIRTKAQKERLCHR